MLAPTATTWPSVATEQPNWAPAAGWGAVAMLQVAKSQAASGGSRRARIRSSRGSPAKAARRPRTPDARLAIGGPRRRLGRLELEVEPVDERRVLERARAAVERRRAGGEAAGRHEHPLPGVDLDLVPSGLGADAHHPLVDGD